LQKIADIGEGKFFRAADYDTLKHVYQEINKLETARRRSNISTTSKMLHWALYPDCYFWVLRLVWRILAFEVRE